MVHEVRTPPTLVAAGYINIDMTAYVPALPAKDDRVTGATIKRALGGMSTNLVCAAARLGAPWPAHCELISTVGLDADSRWAIEELESRGIATRWVARPEDGRITYCLILVEPSGHRAIVSEPLDFDDRQVALRIEEPAAAGTERLLHTEGYRMPSLLPHISRARQLGWRTSIDLDGLPVDWQNPQGMEQLAETFDVIFINRGIAEAVWPDAAPGSAWSREIAAGLSSLSESVGRVEPGRAGTILLTLGEGGVIVVPRGAAPLHVAGTPVKAVDTTGAGDIFAGVFLAIWLNGVPPQKAARYASVAAALSTTGQGAQGRLPSAAEVLTFMGEAGTLEAGAESAAATAVNPAT